MRGEPVGIRKTTFIARNLWIGILVSAGCLAIALQRVDFGEVAHALSKAKYEYLVYSSALTLLACVLRAVRWKLLLLPFKETTFANLFSSLMIGFLGNNILPARLGEFIKAHLLGKKEGLSKSLSFGSIVVDRILDVFALLLVLLFAVTIHDFPEWVRQVASLGALLLVCAFAALLFCYFNRRRFARWLGNLVSPLSKRLSDTASGIFENFMDSFSIVRSPGYFLPSVFVSILIWVVLAAGVHGVFVCLGFELSFWSAFIVMAIVNLGLTIPSSPGFVGTFQLFCIQAMLLFGVQRSDGFSFSILYHLTQFLPTTFIGIIFLSRENLGLRTLSKSVVTMKGKQEKEVDPYPITGV